MQDSAFDHLPHIWQVCVHLFLTSILQISGNDHTRRVYASILAHFLSEKQDPATIGEGDITAYLHQRSTSRRNTGQLPSAFAMRQRLVVVKAFLEFAGRHIVAGQPLYQRTIDFEGIRATLPRITYKRAKRARKTEAPTLAPAATPMSEAEREVWRQVRQSFLQAKQRKSGSKETPKHYASILDAFFGPDFVKSPADVSQQECLAFITAPCYGRIHHGEPAAVSTRAKRLAILKSWYAYCQHWTLPGPDGRPRRLLSVDYVPPTHNIETGKRTRSYRALSMTELERIFACIPDDIRGRRDRSFLTFALTSGRRRAELQRLCWKDIEQVTFESGRVSHVYHYRGKGSSQQIRTKELSPLAYSALLDYLKASGRYDSMQPDSPLWTCIPAWKGLGGRYTPETARGQEPSRQAGRYTAETPVSGQAFCEALQRYAAAASIDKPVSLHGLRHSIARCLYRQCKDPLKIMAFLDHSDLSVTTQYLFELEQVEADEEQRKMEARFSFLATGRESEVQHAR